MAAPTIPGFSVVQLKFSEKYRNGHNLYIKEHSVRDDDSAKPRDKTIFVVNVPPYADEQCLRNVFYSCGPINHVYLHKAPTPGVPVPSKSEFFKAAESITGFKVAYVVFKKAYSIKKAMKMSPTIVKVMSEEPKPALSGITKWCEEYKQEQSVDTEKLQAEIDKYMKAYDESVEEEKRIAMEKEGVPDDEGWVTVTKHGRNKGVPRTKTQEKHPNVKEKKKQENKDLRNFYSFQVRETKREHLAELREKFEEDKQRIALMKQQRRFKPY